MGVEIYLTAKGSDIAPELWERVYRESLVLLDAFPARLTRFEVQELGGENRYAYTPDIVCKRGTPDEHWMVGGDLSSRQEAEDFELYRHHARQFPNGYGTDDPHEVLWADPDDRFHGFHGNGRMLWHAKTQGRPYHLALLAVGMLVESRCPGAAYVIGDIDRHQSELARAWANAVVDEPLDLPICVDPDRLYPRLFELYGQARHAYRRFSDLYRGESSDEWPAIVRHADPPAVRQCLVEGLGSFDSLACPGASHIAVSYLRATGDVAALIDSVREIASGNDRGREGFSLEALLERLCAYSISVPLDELLEHFSRAEPGLRERFQDTIRKREPAAREERLWIDKIRDKLDRIGAAKASARSTVDSPPAGELSIRAQVTAPTTRYPDAEALTRRLGEGLREGLLASPALEQFPNKDALLGALYRATRENGIALTLPSWDVIDALEDDEVLRHLIALALVRERELHFFEFRRYVLEQSQLWGALAGRDAL